MNVSLVYTKFNITGRGVSVSILDDGIEKDHPDLVKNYVCTVFICIGFSEVHFLYFSKEGQQHLLLSCSDIN